MELCCFDLETTGTDPCNDRIVSIGLMYGDSDRPEDMSELYLVVNPGVIMTPENIAIHGITNEDVAGAEPFKAWADIIHEVIRINKNLTGYNIARFDMSMLWHEFARAGIDWDWRRHNVIDSCRLFQKREPRNLKAAVQFYCADTHADEHNALEDSRAAMRVLGEQIKHYQLDKMTPEELAKETADDDGYLDISRKIKMLNGEPAFAFGKWRDEPVSKHIDYANWMLKGEFSADTKRVLLDVIPKVKP